MSQDGSVEREAVRQIGLNTNSTDVVVVERCHATSPGMQAPENLEFCTQLLKQYDKYDYADLMNTTFSLIPAGRSPATYRLAECLSAGSIPVFINFSFVKPFPDRIPWNRFSFSFPIDEAPGLLKTLRAIPEQQLKTMQVGLLRVSPSKRGCPAVRCPSLAIWCYRTWSMREAGDLHAVVVVCSERARPLWTYHGRV